MTSPLAVTLYRDFDEDGRTSMEIYADRLAAGLRAAGGAELEIREYRPVLTRICRRLPERGNMRMRAARYWGYPRQVRGRRNGIHHILDHGYAHLMSVLDPARTVVTVHDAIPILAGRGLIPGIRRARRSWLAEWTARYYPRAARLIAISESTRRDLVAHFGCRPEAVEVIYYGIGQEFSPLAPAERQRARERFGLPGDAKIVLITGHQYYKNHETALEVARLLRERYGSAFRLLRLGLATPEWTELKRRSPVTGNLIEIAYLPNREMRMLYGACDCLLFPSWYEGFGLPPLEAMACGTPAVTSNAASLPEAVGDAALTAAPEDVRGLAEAVMAVLENDPLRATLIAKGIERAKRFTWDATAGRVREIYRTLSAHGEP